MMLAEGSPEPKSIPNRRQERESKCKTQEYGTEGHQNRGGVIFVSWAKLKHKNYPSNCVNHSVRRESRDLVRPVCFVKHSQHETFDVGTGVTLMESK